ncbi:MAG: UDP-glucose 4-epimerase family protein [Gemmatimonadales bacterium]
MTRVLVTGASGFIGRALCDTLSARGMSVRAAVRRPSSMTGDVRMVGEIGPDTEWRRALHGMDAVVHLAARVHVMRDAAADPLAAFRAVNVAGTERLARECAGSQVRRLVFVSSIKVNGERTLGRPFSEADPPAPEDAYGVSKLEAEQALQRVAAATGLEAVIVRPCLVYGPGVRGNLGRLLAMIERGVPLPLASVNNRRSLIGLTNLCDLLAPCVTHPAAAGETWLASDGEDLSTPELIRALAAGAGRTARLVPFPPRWLELAARLAGARGAYDRVCGSLQADSSKARRSLDWRPPLSAMEGLRLTGAWHQGRAR